MMVNAGNGHRRLADPIVFQELFLSGQALAAGSVCLGVGDRKLRCIAVTPCSRFFDHR